MSRCRASSKLPDWNDVLEWAKAPQLVPNDKEIGKELDSGVLFEYVAVEGTDGDYVRANQGRALAYQTKSAKTTRLGTYFEGAHVSANDGDLDDYLLGDEGLC